jgi:hypothetical protein
MSKQVGFWFGNAAVAGLLMILAGCEGAAESLGPVPGGPAGDTDVGSVSVSLTSVPGYQFGDVSYDVSGHGFHVAGTFSVAASARLSTLIGGIPFGTGYAVELTAQDLGHKLRPCTGSASFDVSSPATVAVPVHLTCHELSRTMVQAVPVPWWTSVVLAALLIGLGSRGVYKIRN